MDFFSYLCGYFCGFLVGKYEDRIIDFIKRKIGKR